MISLINVASFAATMDMRCIDQDGRVSVGHGSSPVYFTEVCQKTQEGVKDLGIAVMDPDQMKWLKLHAEAAVEAYTPEGLLPYFANRYARRLNRTIFGRTVEVEPRSHGRRGLPERFQEKTGIKPGGTANLIKGTYYSILSAEQNEISRTNIDGVIELADRKIKEAYK